MEVQSDRPTLLVLEPTVLAAELLAEWLQRRGLQIGGHFADCHKAWDYLAATHPDFALLDLQLTDCHTMTFIQRARAANVTTRFIVLADRADSRLASDLIRAGANGYFLRTGRPLDLLDAIRQVRAGGVYLAPGLTLRTGPALAAVPKLSDPLSQLSLREHQVFSLLVEGVRAKEIAARLELSPKTVDTYRSNLMRKLGIGDVPGLVKLAIQRQMISAR
jgi:DNA-binding NarL/FixJ family response regulator